MSGLRFQASGTSMEYGAKLWETSQADCSSPQVMSGSTSGVIPRERPVVPFLTRIQPGFFASCQPTYFTVTAIPVDWEMEPEVAVTVTCEVPAGVVTLVDEQPTAKPANAV